jgi:hypothetical protein
MAEDRVRVLRVIEYVGPRRAVELQVAWSIHGTRLAHRDEVTISVATIGLYPEILAAAEPDTAEKYEERLAALGRSKSSHREEVD